MNIVDVVVILVIALAAVWGARQGGLAQLILFACVLPGVWLGTQLAHRVAADITDPSRRALVALAIVVIVSAVSFVAGAVLGAFARQNLQRDRAATTVDRILGVVAAVVAVCIAVWVLVPPLGGAPLSALSARVRDSATWSLVERYPPPAPLQRAWREVVQASGVPTVFENLPDPFTGTITPPDPALPGAPGVSASAASTVKVLAAACGRESEGSGWVAADGYVVTNAHVVAGSREPLRVETSAGNAVNGVVVGFDSRRDVAVVYAPRLHLPALQRTGGAQGGASVAALGYPGNGPLTVSPGRVRRTLDARGLDIYDAERVDREVLEILADIRRGNSGGPLVTPEGTVVGMVFAASTTEKGTGYALSGAEIAPVLEASLHRTEPVSSAACLAP